MAANQAPKDYEDLAKQLSESPDHRVVRRFVPQDQYTPDDGSEKKVVAFLDTETTGRDYQKHDVFEIGIVLADYCPKSGRIFNVIDRYSGLNDPGYPLPEVIVELTGVKPEEVIGQKFDFDKINEIVARADLFVAQNAAFDRKFMEKIVPALAKKPWACNLFDGPWDEMGYPIKKQEYLAYAAAGVFYDAHRALTDSEVLLHIVATTPAPDSRPVFAHILASAREESYVVWAVNSPFEKKDKLKEDGYKWSDGTTPGQPKAWYKVTRDVEAELQYLGENIYSRKQAIDVDMMIATDRYSVRHTERQQMDVIPPARPTNRP